MENKKGFSKLKNKYCDRIWNYLLKKSHTKEEEEAFESDVKVLSAIIEIEKWGCRNN